MKNKTIFLITACTLCFLFYRCNTPASNTTAGNDSASSNNMYAGYSSQIESGQHLATICACGDCHTPKKMTDHGPVDDSSSLFSGNPAQMPAPILSAAQLSQGMAATNALTA